MLGAPRAFVRFADYTAKWIARSHLPGTVFLVSEARLHFLKQAVAHQMVRVSIVRRQSSEQDKPAHRLQDAVD